jgi:hypothetical protein
MIGWLHGGSPHVVDAFVIEEDAAVLRMHYWIENAIMPNCIMVVDTSG